MKVNLEQNTPEWAKWRSKGLNASEAPTIMGNPHPASKAKSWARLRGFKSEGYPQTNSFEERAFEYGHEKEAEARARLNQAWNVVYEPQCHEVMVKGLNKPLQASLDGVAAANVAWMPKFVEIKSVRNDKAPALSILVSEQRIPLFVRWQMLQQAVAVDMQEDELAAYVVIDGTGKLYVREIQGKHLYGNGDRERLIERWKHFENGKPQSSVDQQKFKSFIDPYAQTKLRFDLAKMQLAKRKKALLDFLGGASIQNEQGASITKYSVAKSDTQGLLQHLWDRLEKGGLSTQDESLDSLKKQFEGEPKSYWKILLERKENEDN